jgi:hypothetical protein
MINQRCRAFWLTKVVLLIAVVPPLLLVSACKQEAPCKGEDTLAQESACFAATVLTQGGPSQVGNSLKLKMKIAAVNSQLSPIPATISTTVFNLQGQLVAQQTQPPIPSNSNFQDVPIWTNVTAASGTYSLDVTVSFGDCGSKRMCLTAQVAN